MNHRQADPLQPIRVWKRSSCQWFQGSFDECHSNHAAEVFGCHFEPRADAALFF